MRLAGVGVAAVYLAWDAVIAAHCARVAVFYACADSGGLVSRVPVEFCLDCFHFVTSLYRELR